MPPLSAGLRDVGNTVMFCPNMLVSCVLLCVVACCCDMLLRDLRPLVQVTSSL